MIRRPPRSTRTDTRFPTRRSSDLAQLAEAAVEALPEEANSHYRLAFALGRYSQGIRSEEHTSELQSLMRISYAVFCLKKKSNKTKPLTHVNYTRLPTQHNININQIYTTNNNNRTNIIKRPN